MTFVLKNNDYRGIMATISNFDVYNRAGGKGVAMVQTYNTTVADGNLRIVFSAKLDQMKVSAIEISAAGAMPVAIAPTKAPTKSPTVPISIPDPTRVAIPPTIFIVPAAPNSTSNAASPGIRINCGGNAYTDTAGNIWEADTQHSYFTGGQSASNFGLVIQGTDDDTIYQTERTGGRTVSYIITNLASGSYNVNLHFAEIYWTTANSRLFDIAIQGTTVATNFDLWTQAGGKGIAIVKAYNTTVSNDGILKIAFITKLDQMKVSAIEVLPIGSLSYEAPAKSPTKSPIVPVTMPVAIPVAIPPTTTNAATPGIRINCGGDAYTDIAGNVWEADTAHSYFTGGHTASNIGLAIQGTDDDIIYQTERTGARTVSYIVTNLANGSYYVKLHFAEIYWTTPNSRLFDITIQGTTVATNFELWTQAGGKGIAMVKTYNTTVSTDGILKIDFTTKLDQMKVSAIEVLPIGLLSYAAPAKAPTKSPTVPITIPASTPQVPISTIIAVPTSTTNEAAPGIRINCGSEAYTDTAGNVWEADNVHSYFTGGHTASNVGLAIQGTEDDTLYQTERTGGRTVSYIITNVAEGLYSVRLHFAEIYWTTPNSRLFDITIEGEKVVTNFDVWTQAGGKGIALIKTYNVTVSDGILKIDFTTKLDQMKVSAIEVIAIALAIREPTSSPSPQPTRLTSKPSASPTSSHAPSLLPSTSTKPSQSPSVFVFQNIFINCGGDTFVDTIGRVWESDDLHHYYNGSRTAANLGLQITNTLDDYLYQTERTGTGTLKYEIPLPDGEYNVGLHFAEIYWNGPNARLMDIKIQGDTVETNFDVWAAAGGKGKRDVQEYTIIIENEHLIIELITKLDGYKISGISIIRQGDHLAHAVAGGPYAAVDTNGDGFGTVAVDAFQSHSHGHGLFINKYEWRFKGNVIATTQKANLTLPLGSNEVTLIVEDNEGNQADTYTEIQVFEVGFPFIDFLTPTAGDIYGSTEVIIHGSGFNWTADQITVHFGKMDFTGSAIEVIDETRIRIIGTPANTAGASVQVTVQNPISTSNPKMFSYVQGVPIDFIYGELLDEYGPTTLAFGPDGFLYIGTLNGYILKIELDHEMKILSLLKSPIIKTDGDRSITGIAFDPMDVGPNPKVYVTHSNMFHGSCQHSSGPTINGKISVVSGANLDVIQHIVKGLPVSDHDHGPNGIQFGDNGELYLMIGGNTNAGVPGGLLTGCGPQKENYFSGACLKIDLTRPDFDGFLEYNATTGDVTRGVGVDVFAPGSRNPWDVVLHSNGYLYATDNGPNTGYGKKSVDCTTSGNDPNFPDELNVIIEGEFYGHANRKRGETDPRQCTYHGPDEESIPGVYRRPLTTLPSSSDGIIEWETEHFGGQMRGNLIIGKFVGVLWRVILSQDGLSVPNAPLVLHEQGGLDVTQGPDGSLFVAKAGSSKVTYLIPKEDPSLDLNVKASWPRRGPMAGGSTLTLYGELFDIEGTPTVTVGGAYCPIITSSASKITCKLPPGSGKADVVVTSGNSTSTLSAGYRYITGGPYA